MTVGMGGVELDRPPLRTRVLIAALFAGVAGAITWRSQYVVHALGGDYLMLWRAAHIVLDGGDPYRLMWWMKLPALHTPFNYPLPGVGMGLPFVWLRPQNAAIAFVTCSAGLLGFALTRDSFARVPILLSIPFIFAAQLSQTSLLILALGLVPAAAGLTVMKPNIGLALFSWRPHNRTVVVGGILLLGTVIISPSWPAEWIVLVRTSPTHHAPIATGGIVALVALLRWRRPEARLLVAMALIPHGLYFYDELPLWLVAATRREAVILTVMSWVGWFGWLAMSNGSGGPHLRDAAPWIVASLYAPCAIMILLRPNESEAPDVAGAPAPTNRVARTIA
ncbi:MAG TPA: hypothetical protein VLN59_12280 [Burkholderiales bacterium]|nr:hypothetical protein [Burkholderiales bacterium]